MSTAGSANSVVQNLANSLRFTDVAKRLGVDPVLLMWWSFTYVVCVIQLLVLWKMPPAVVSWLCSDGSAFKSSVVFLGIPFADGLRRGWIDFASFVEHHRTTSTLWWRVLAIFYFLWFLAMAGPLSIISRLVKDPNTSRAIYIGVLLPVGIATLLWVLMNPRGTFLPWLTERVPSGWIEPPGSSESIVWVTASSVALLCGLVEYLHAFYPPLIKALLGTIPVPLFHVGILLSAGFACVLAGIEVDGNTGAAASDTDANDNYVRARTYHLTLLLVSTSAVVIAYLVLPAFGTFRRTSLAEALRPLSRKKTVQ